MNEPRKGETKMKTEARDLDISVRNQDLAPQGMPDFTIPGPLARRPEAVVRLEQVAPSLISLKEQQEARRQREREEQRRAKEQRVRIATGD